MPGPPGGGGGGAAGASTSRAARSGRRRRRRRRQRRGRRRRSRRRGPAGRPGQEGSRQGGGGRRPPPGDPAAARPLAFGRRHGLGAPHVPRLATASARRLRPRLPPLLWAARRARPAVAAAAADRGVPAAAGRALLLRARRARRRAQHAAHDGAARATTPTLAALRLRGMVDAPTGRRSRRGSRPSRPSSRRPTWGTCCWPDAGSMAALGGARRGCGGCGSTARSSRGSRRGTLMLSPPWARCGTSRWWVHGGLACLHGLHGVVEECMGLHGVAWGCMGLHGVAWGALHAAQPPSSFVPKPQTQPHPRVSPPSFRHQLLPHGAGPPHAVSRLSALDLENRCAARGPVAAVRHRLLLSPRSWLLATDSLPLLIVSSSSTYPPANTI